jgi:hypothetical protein
VNGRRLPRASFVALGLATFLAAAVGSISARSIIRTIWDMRNPCVRWVPNMEVTMVAVAPAGCRGVSVHGQSLVHAALISALLPGGLLLSIALFGVGVLRSRPPLDAASVLMLAETLVVFTMAPLRYSLD